MMGHGLGDDIDGVGVIEEPCIGTHLLHILDDAFHDVDCSQRHEEAAGSLRFLSNHAMLERNAFVKVTRLEPAGPETCQDGITSLQSFAPICGSSNG